MAVRRMDIQFKDPSASFRAGESISGNVVLDISGELRLKTVRLQLYGLARVSWDERKSYTKGTSSKTTQRNVDVYLDETLMLISKTEGLTGRKSWPFNVRLPAFLPATFEGHYGKVQYWSKLTLERPWKGDMELTKNFTVLGAFDLNIDNEARNPVDGRGDTMVGLCCKTGPLVGSIQVEKRGFVAGQNIPFKAKIENNSSRKLLVRVVFTQQATYRAGGKTKKHTIVVKGIQQGDVEPGEEMESSSEIKNIPAVPPTRLGGGCKNIEVKYFLTLVAVPGGLGGKDMEVPVEITLGTVPLRALLEAKGTPQQSSSPRLKVKAQARVGSDSPAIDKGEVKGSPRAPLARRNDISKIKREWLEEDLPPTSNKVTGP